MREQVSGPVIDLRISIDQLFLCDDWRLGLHTAAPAEKAARAGLSFYFPVALLGLRLLPGSPWMAAKTVDEDNVVEAKILVLSKGASMNEESM